MSSIFNAISPASPYAVMSASAHMPNSVKAHYRRVAIVLTDGVTIPAMISEHARGVIRIIDTYERLHADGVHTAYASALADALQRVADLNATHAQSVMSDKRNGMIPSASL